MKKVLILTPYGINTEIKHAGGKTSTYYFSSLLRNPLLDLTFFILYVRSDDYEKFTTEFASARDISLPPSRNILQKLSNYFFYRIIAQLLRPVLFEYHHINAQKKIDLLKSLTKARDELGYHPDVIICDFGDFLFQVQDVKKIYPAAKYVAFVHDYNYKHVRRLYDGRPFSKLLLKRFFKKEHSCLQTFDLILPHSSADAEAIKQDCNIDDKKIKSIVPYFDDYFKLGQQKCRYQHNNTIIYYGAMGRPQNYEAVYWFLNNVWPEVLKRHPSLQFNIIGSGLPDSDKKQFLMHQHVNVLGFVANPVEYFVNALCTAVPLQVGSGIKVKVLESMSVGLPVLTNEIGIEGINGVEGRDYLFCKSPDDYISAISKLYTNANLRNGIIDSSFEFINQNFNKEKSEVLFNYYIEKI